MEVKVFCEYLENPVGIDMEHPRFSWAVENAESGRMQKSYRIRVAKNAEDLTKCKKLSWDTGEILSEQSLNIPYAGDKLETAETYFYEVMVTDNTGDVIASNISLFTTGIMEKNVWKAPWLGGPWMEEWAFWFRSSIQIKKSVTCAFIYVVSPNYYVLTVNGKRCTDAVLQNANTDSSKTVLYATYDVKESLNEGENILGVELGNGWKALNMSVNEGGVGEHLFSLQMLIKYEDGSSEWIYSESDKWRYTNRGPLKENSIYQGETYDARCDMTGWDMVGYDESAAEVPWYQAVEFEPEAGKVRAQYLEPIKVVAYRKPEKIYKIEDGSYTFDMGQNFAGWSRLQIEGTRGQEIKLVYAELIYDDYRVNQLSIRGMRATDTYILKGEGVETYEPDFTYHGFRYVQVFGLTHEPSASTITGCVVRSAVEQIGEFTCDNALLNKLQENINWTEQSNLHSIPTDCPQRNERLGWINDMTVRNECALYNFRLAQLYTKWLQDVRDTQGEKTGAISDTAPFRVFGCRPADPVGAITFLLPWNMYRHYRDKRVMEECYETNKKLLGYLKRNSTDYIMRWAQMGDWAAPINGTDMSSIGGGAVSTVTPTQLMATAYFYYDCLLMEKTAALLSHEEDESYYRSEAEKIKKAYIKTYYNAEKKYFYSNSQGCNTISLYMGLVPEEDKQAVLENLVMDIVETNDMHLTTGNLCSRYVIEVLLQNGYEEVAYQLLTQTTYPSWGYMIENGATTIWERWEKITEECTMSLMASYNHPMYGAVGVCFYKYFAGIDADDTIPGFKKVIVKPIIPKELKKVDAKLKTMCGLVQNSWKKQEEKFWMQTVIPFGSIGEISIPIKNLNLSNPTIVLNGETVYENGVFINSTYCQFEKADDHYVSFQVTSGIFEFCAK